MLIGALPLEADAFYIHDVAIAQEARGRGHAEAVVTTLLEVVSCFPRTCLISVYGTVPFWQRFGFVESDEAPAPEKLAAYGADARFMVRLTPD
ncbi:GNAT family N-acetyltransferase [Jiella pelagia]|uniref:GNAT family N-acetyltransferase n=1 Tax=Jiella pelagia TaxID=2986949 RepID=A0ABY7BVQ5_9HYPH|nr:GNAT family N-acetyltransferase [Jiella pelagia]WAP67891.1 GNAT family N-acetyltransferase [Jiella pelagia]